MTRRLRLKKEWVLGERIGGGGFGQVYVANSPGEVEAVAKLVPKDPGAERELLFVDVAAVRNVIPVIDSGETPDSWVIVMPRARMSLREYIRKIGAAFEVDTALKVISDIATALVDLEERKIVHRDLKPENVLLLGQIWCLADFGISRYAEATTAPDTRKYALSPLYAAPERWRAQRATTATDVYSLGVLAHEMLSGSRPFMGANSDELREQHLHARPAPLANVPIALESLIAECLYKSPEARPSPTGLLARLSRVLATSSSAGVAKLREAHRAEAVRQGELRRRESEHQTEAERRSALAADGSIALARIGRALQEAIIEAAPAATLTDTGGGGWELRLNKATLKFSSAAVVARNPWGSSWGPPKFDVIAHAAVSVRTPPDRYEYEGREHALWYCDARKMNEYQWFETAFMISPLIPRRGRRNPFVLEPGEESAKALAPGMTEFQVAWPFTPIVIGDMNEFIDRWSGWFADAAVDRLSHPSTMPERSTEGSWRRS